MLAAVPPARGALPLLALQRARFQRRTATAAVAGVVASLALSVALTVMVASFRVGVAGGERFVSRVQVDRCVGALIADQPRDERFDARLGERPHEAVDRLTVDEGVDGGDRLHPQLARIGRVLVDIDLDQFHRAAGGADLPLRPLLEGFGQTECAGVSHVTLPGRVRLGTVGELLPCFEQKLADDGELLLRGPCVFPGYLHNPEATRDTVDTEGWLHTGDLGRMDSRGFLKITGRVKEMIIRGGENLFPAEIENTMLEHEAVGEVAVVGVPDDKWGEQVVCFIRSTGDQLLTANGLKSFIRERLSPQKSPAFWVSVTDWPLTGSGKIQKFKLKEAYEAGKYTPLD